MTLDPGAVRWVEESLACRVSIVEPLAGGITAGMYRVRISSRRGGSHAVVLRRWDGRVVVDGAALVRRQLYAAELRVGAVHHLAKIDRTMECRARVTLSSR